MAIKEGLPPLVSGGLRQVEAGLVDILGPWPPPLLFTFSPSAFSSFSLSAWSLWPHFSLAEGGASAGTGGKVLSRDWQAHPCFYPGYGPPPLPPGPKPACKQRWRRPDLPPTGSGAAGEVLGRLGAVDPMEALI